MDIPKRRIFFGVGVLGCALGVSVGGCSSGTDRIEAGVWGGEGIELVVGADSATASFDCASGVVPADLGIADSGRFEIWGTMTLGHGGPARENEVPDVHPAVYAGRLDGGTLLLSIRITDLGTDVGPFRLRRGEAGLLRLCL